MIAARSVLRSSTLPRAIRAFGASASVPPPNDYDSVTSNSTDPIPSTIAASGAAQAASALSRLAETLDPETKDLTYSVRRTILPLSHEQTPKINGNDTFIAPNAQVIGDVFVGEGSSLWYGSVVRGDNSRVFIGAKCSVGDKTIINTTPSKELQVRKRGPTRGEATHKERSDPQRAKRLLSRSSLRSSWVAQLLLPRFVASLFVGRSATIFTLRRFAPRGF